MKKIIKISFGDESATNLFLRQTSGNAGVWKNCIFAVNQDVEYFDWWFVCHAPSLREKESAYGNSKNIVYISMEPNEKISNVRNKFLKQFSTIVICDREIKHPNIIYRNGLSWWAGIGLVHSNGKVKFLNQINYDYDAFLRADFNKKINKISVVVSGKKFLDGHIKRLDFIEKLKKSEIGDLLDIYGDGYNTLIDKIDAIKNYKYHLVLENSNVNDYWSEKLADAFLGLSYPIYSGCDNIYKYFDSRALSIIDIDDYENSIKTIKNIIDSKLYEKNIDHIKEARLKILNDYNICEIICGIVNSGYDYSSENYIEKVTLYPVGHTITYKIKVFLKKLLT